MKIGRNRKVVAATVAIAAIVVTGGAAIAATGGSAQRESDAIIDDAAATLGVEPAQLTSALKQALTKRIDAALADGVITEGRANELKARIAADDFPLLGFRHGHGRRGPRAIGRGVALEAAAAYLGLTKDAVREALHDGRSLAAQARARNKPVDGLVDAMFAAARERLAAAVAAGRLTDAERDRIVATLRARIAERVERTRPPRGR